MSAPTSPFPVKQGRLAVYILFFFAKKSFNILSCVRKHAPIASQGSALPSECGGSERPRKKEFVVFI